MATVLPVHPYHFRSSPSTGSQPLRLYASKIPCGLKLYVVPLIMQPTVPDGQQMLNRKPPFGLNVIAAAKQLPQYTLRVVETSLVTHKAQGPVEVELEVECGMIVERDAVPMKRAKSRTSDMTLVLTVTSELDFVDFRRIS